ncbi:MAG: N-acetyltransferase [Winogradskyella sp.]|nr:N-acetyltransferase [Winogradskyella sp.]NNF85700.1 N-acetyltransferase [Winogradskyella sp.]NNL82105.1 N-acetyltransferase [Winogradskyella sp.]
MDIKHKQQDHKGEFFIERDGSKKAHMTYSMAGADKMIIDHTEVADELRGQGVGEKLVERSVKYARERDIKILPLCAFANAVFKKTDSYNDVLA